MKEIFLREEEYLRTMDNLEKVIPKKELLPKINLIREDHAFDYSCFYLRHPDDIMYARVSKEQSGLPLDIMLDEAHSYVGTHPLWILIIGEKTEHGYDKYPLTVERYPKFLGNLSYLPIKINEFGRIWKFVQEHVEELRRLADEELFIEDFCKLCFPVKPVEDPTDPDAIGLYVVRDPKTDKLNFMRKNGTLLFHHQWFDAIGTFQEYPDGRVLSEVVLDGKKMMVEKNGKLINI